MAVHFTGETTATITSYQCKQSNSLNILSTLHKKLLFQSTIIRSGTLRCRRLDAADSMPPTRCQAKPMPSQHDAKIYCLTFKLLLTSGVLVVSVSSRRHRVGDIELGHFPIIRSVSQKPCSFITRRRLV